jgi:hypothetical protein
MKTPATLFISILFCTLFFCDVHAQDGDVQHSFSIEHTPLRAALDSLMRWYPVYIVYLDNDVEGITVSQSCTLCTFKDALNALLSGTSLQWMRRENQIILKPRTPQEVQPFATLSGFVKDSATGELITGATVFLQESADQQLPSVRHWCSTNEFGFYALPRLPLGIHTIVVRAIGYEPSVQNIDLTNAESLTWNCTLQQKDIVMSEVTIEGRRSVFSSAETFSRGVYFRSVPSDQNQYLLDGGRIYNPSHFGSVLTTFNTAVLNDVQVALGGLPPFYGGNVGGIIDLSLRNGSQRGLATSAGIGSLGASFTVDGPFDNRTTYLISGRKGYPDAAMRLFHPAVSPSTMNSFELTAKLNHHLSSSDQLSLNGYFGNDSYSNNADGSGIQLVNNFSWGNKMVNLRWTGVASSSLFMYSSIVYSRYDLDLQHTYSSSPLLYAGTRLSSKFSIEDISFRAHAESYYDEDHTIRAGVEVIHHNVDGYISEFSIQNASFSLSSLSSWELSVYVQDQWKVLPRVLAEFGGRATSFTSDNGSFSAVDPRFSLITLWNEQTRTYASISAINQFMHPYRNSGVFLLYPTIFFYPSTEKMHPSTSLQATVGIQRDMNDNMYRVSAETYYRITNNLHEFRSDSLVSSSEDLSNLILTGTGRSYGFICKLEKRLGDFTGSLTYNLSWTLEKFLAINNGNEFAPPFDRRHEIQFTSQYALSAQWIVSLLCVYASGQSYLTIPKTGSTDRGKVFGASEPNTVLSYNEFLDVNGSRLPGFQRLELSLAKRFAWMGVSGHFSLRLLNSYGLIDPFTWELHNSAVLRSAWSATFHDTGLFPLYPSIEVMIKL